MNKKKTLTKKEILYFIDYEIREAVKSARRYHRNYLESIRKKDKIAEDYDYEHREEALQLARRMKNLTLPIENHLHIYTGRQHISRQRRMKREEAAGV